MLLSRRITQYTCDTSYHIIGGCLPTTRVELWQNKFAKMGRLPQTPSNQKKTDRPSLFFLFFPCREKAPPAISLRAFHAEALPCFSAGTSVARLTALISLGEIFSDCFKICLLNCFKTVVFILLKPNFEISP